MLHTVNFETRIQNDLSTTTDNIFVDNSRINLSSIPPTINGLLGQVAQILTNKQKIHICNNKQISFNAENQNNRQRNNQELSDSTYNPPPPKKNRESFYTKTDPNHIFNSFLCTSLNIFQASFPVKYKCVKDKNGLRKK
jgi:hypothetical protein